MEQSQQFSLRKITKQRLKGAFVAIRQAFPQIQQYLLIVDESTVKVISAYMKMAELMEFGVSGIEKLELSRKPFPKLNVIYFIYPQGASISILRDDFADKKNPRYGGAHLLFSNDLTQEQMQQLGTGEVINRILSLKILNLDFSCNSDRVFNIGMNQVLTTAFSDKPSQGKLLEEVANKLCTLLISFDKFYSFELLYNVHDNKISEQVARATQARLYQLFNSLIKNKSEQYDNIEKEAGKITVLIVDRSFDPSTPLLHDFFYQPMIYDLLDIKQDIFEEKVILSDADDIFYRYKYRHIGEVLEGIPQEFKEFVNTNTSAKVQQGQVADLDLKQMSEIVRSMPQYNQLLSKYTTHMSILEKSWSLFEKKDLKDLGSLEQSLVTGIDDQKNNVSTTKILTQVGAKLLNDNLIPMDKLRLMLLTTISLEMSEQDRKFLTEKISFDHQRAIMNLKYLGINPFKGGAKKGKSSNKITDNIKKQAKNKMSAATMELCRNTPLLETLIETYVETNKKPQFFESIKINEDGMGNNKASSKSIRQKGQLMRMMKDQVEEEMVNQNKLIIFVVGGIGYNEIRAIMSNQKINQQITIVGSTQILKPADFCTGLLNFKTD